MRVGFIGLGRMGKGMARRILGGGHDLAVYDIVREATTELGAAGARIASSVSDVSKGRDVVITMLVEDESVNNVVLGPGGLRDAFPRRSSWPTISCLALLSWRKRRRSRLYANTESQRRSCTM